jgi:formylglycine-generating enzyme required for sulfatase activity
LHPVEQVSWDDCAEVLGRLGLLLPTEAQWEYAARAGTQTRWWPGDGPERLARVANLADAFGKQHGFTTWTTWEPWSDGHTVHAPVGRLAPNPFGLHDVHGNVWEWCQDAFEGASYGWSAIANPVYPHEGSATRVNRGGGFNGTVGLARSAYRGVGTSSTAVDVVGVRPARPVEE